MWLDSLTVNLQYFQSTKLAAVFKLEFVLQTEITTDVLDFRDWVRKPEIAKINSLLNSVEHHRSHTKFKQVRSLRHIGIADDNVQTAPLRGISVRLVAGINDAAVEGRLQRDLLLHIISALRNLKSWFGTVLFQAHPTSARDDDARYEKWDERLREYLKVGVARILIVLMRAIRCTLAINVIFVELQRRARLIIR